MDLEILCRFLFQSSERIFERPKQLVWTAIKQIFLTPISPFAKDAKNSRIRNSVERTILYKI
jgi:hypothetical protein